MISKDTRTIKKHFNNINQEFDPMLKEEYYNCWSLTSFLNGWEKNVYWMSESEIEQHLSKKTRKIKNIRVGDIVEFRTSTGNMYTCKNGIVHTAVITEIKGKTKEIICVHKPGSCQMEIRDLKGIEKMYSDYADVVVFSRFS